MSASSLEIIRSISVQYPLLGIALMHHRTTRGGPLKFEDKPYLIELYKDFPKIDGADGMKAVQVGWSELLIQLVLERTAWAGRVAAYVLPTFLLRDRFVQNRVDPLLRTVPAYRDKLNDGNSGSMRIKKFTKGNLIFLGSNTVNDFIEFSADVLIVDEYDRCEQQNLSLARDRLRASPYPQMFRIGNPTLPNMGISRLYNDSDQRKYHFKCERCNERQPLDWFLNIVERDDEGKWVLQDKSISAGSKHRARPVCRKCKMPFERRAEGSCWVAEHPSVYRRGYHMSRMDIISQSLEELYREWLEAQGITSKISAFYCSVLGIPYEEAGTSINNEMLTKICTGDVIVYGGGDIYNKKMMVAGVDVGNLLNINISMVEMDAYGGRVRRCVYVSAVHTFEQVYDLFMRYHVDCAVVDARPEIRKAQELRDKCRRIGKTQVWLAQFHPTDRVGQQDYGMRIDYRSQVITVDRTQLLDATMDDIRYDPPRRVFPADAMTVEGWSEQMKAAKRVLNGTGTRFIWSEGSKADHYRMSDSYERVAADLLVQGAQYHVL